MDLLATLRVLTIFVTLFISYSTSLADTFVSNGVRIHFEVLGRGEPVVLVHGGMGSGEMWKRVGMVKALEAKGFRVVLFDMRGHGRSDKPHDPKLYGYEMSNDIKRLLDHLQIAKAHVVGYSQGSLVANRFRVKYPARLSSLVLGGGAAMNEDFVWVRKADEIADAVIAGDLSPMFRALTPKGRMIPPKEEIRKIYNDISKTNDMKAVAASVRAQGFPDSAKELRSNIVPTLALIGADDPNKTSVDWTRKLMARLRVVVVENVGHELFEDARFVESTVAFIAQNRSAKGKLGSLANECKTCDRAIRRPLARMFRRGRRGR